MKRRLAIVCSHPIQYYVPFFKELQTRGKIDVKVFYTLGEAASNEGYDPGFGKHIKWDLPLLQGYEFEFLENVAKSPGLYQFNGIINTDIITKIKSFNPTAILVYGWAFRSHLYVLRQFSNKIPVFFRGDSNLLDEKTGIKQFARKLFLTWVYKHIDIALYVGKNNFDYYLKFGIKQSQLVFAPHAVENKRFSDYNPDSSGNGNLFRRQLGIGKGEFVFLFSGKLEGKKNPNLLVHAFIRAEFSGTCHLVIVGSGILKEQLTADSIGHKNIHFLDFQNQTLMPAIYQMADVFVLPSQGPGETWGLAVNEAMASGRPVIISDKCGCAVDLVDDGVNGYVFRSNDEFDLLNKMLQIYSNSELPGKMGQSALKKIALYSIEKVCDVVENQLLLIA